MQGLDRFAQFFISPTFNEEFTMKEVNAVNSEFEKNILEDVRREKMIFKSLAKEGFIFFFKNNK